MVRQQWISTCYVDLDVIDASCISLGRESRRPDLESIPWYQIPWFIRTWSETSCYERQRQNEFKYELAYGLCLVMVQVVDAFTYGINANRSTQHIRSLIVELLRNRKISRHASTIIWEQRSIKLESNAYKIVWKSELNNTKWMKTKFCG